MIRPCYNVLKNNVSTIEMEMSCQEWEEGTEEFVTHNVLADYIQHAAITNNILDNLSFNTRVNHVTKVGSSWQLEVAKLVEDGRDTSVADSIEVYPSSL